MRRAKLEIYVDILKVLAHLGPMKLTNIKYKSNLNSSTIKKYLYFLVKQNLMEERTEKKEKPVFAITQRGITVLKFFKELSPEISVTEQ